LGLNPAHGPLFIKKYASKKLSRLNELKFEVELISDHEKGRDLRWLNFAGVWSW
jgi:hypothetical protein